MPRCVVDFPLWFADRILINCAGAPHHHPKVLDIKKGGSESQAHEKYQQQGIEKYSFPFFNSYVRGEGTTREDVWLLGLFATLLCFALESLEWSSKM